MSATWHWVCLDDDDLAMIENGPEATEGDEPSYQDLLDWIFDVQEAVLESLETA